MPLAFILTGQGAQWPGMGKDLMESFPLYRQTIENLDESLSGLKHPPDWKLAGKNSFLYQTSSDGILC